MPASSSSSPLTSFQVGDVVQLKGKKNGDHTTIHARRLTLLSPHQRVE
jgi:hypothetical protein